MKTDNLKNIDDIRIIDGKKTMPLQIYAKHVKKSRQTIYNWLQDHKIKSIYFGYQQFIILE